MRTRMIAETGYRAARLRGEGRLSFNALDEVVRYCTHADAADADGNFSRRDYYLKLAIALCDRAGR